MLFVTPAIGSDIGEDAETEPGLAADSVSSSSGDSFTDGFIVMPNILQVLREHQYHSRSQAGSPLWHSNDAGVLEGVAEGATGVAPGSGLAAADDDTTSHPERKRCRSATGVASDGCVSSRRRMEQEAAESEGDGDSACSSSLSSSSSDDGDAVAHKMDALEHMMGDLTSRITRNAACIEQMNADIVTMASSRDIRLRRVWSLQHQLQDQEAKAAVLRGDLAHLRASTPSAPRLPQPIFSSGLERSCCS